MRLAERHRKFTVEEFHRMGEAGILREDDRVELLDGEIVEMSPTGSRHAACVKRLNRLLTRRIGERGLVGVQDPILLSDEAELYPDVSLLQPRPDFYAANPPRPNDVMLIVEVADTSLSYDAGEKCTAYARAGVPEVWIVDLRGGRVLVRRDAGAGRYHVDEARSRGERLLVTALPGVEPGVDEVLPD